MSVGVVFGIIIGIVFEVLFWGFVISLIIKAITRASKNQGKPSDSLPPFQNTISNANEDKSENIEQEQKSYTYCAYCGSKVNADAKKCSSCGAKIDK